MMAKMLQILLTCLPVLSIFISSGHGQDAVYVTGHQGRAVTILCPYHEGYGSDYQNYLCRGSCGNADVLIESRIGVSGEIKRDRYSIRDDAENRVFPVTISDLQPSDAGQYWCGVNKAGKDLYTEVQLKVTASDNPDVPRVSTQSPITPTSGTDSLISTAPSFVAPSIPKTTKQALRLKVTLGGATVDLNDPAVTEDILKQVKGKLKKGGVSGDVKLTWKKQPDGKIFKKTKKTEL